MRFDWITRGVAAALVCLFAVAPAAVAICGRDCGAARGARVSEHHNDHAGHSVPGSDSPSPDREAHDCHADVGSVGLEAIAAGPRACTHSTYESDPAKLAPTASDVFALHHALPATGASPDVAPPLPSWQGSARAAIPAQETTPALVLPLRI